ncbi:MAG: PQQ-binding-like beta-propeller repeat protein [Gemmataceae bacterium]
MKGEPRQPPGDVGESQLVCLSLTPGPGGQRLRWSVRGFDVGRKEYAIFEGAPLVHDGRVWIAATRFEGDRVVTAVHCYPAHPEDTTAPLLWRTEVCETRELLPDSSGADVDRKQRRRHHLLTLAGSKVVYCSHSGAVVALDARTGRRAWAVRYPRRDVREPDDNPSLRDLLPPLYAEGRLYVAPSDSDRLMCLDPNTGATIWDRDRLDVVHLVGVGHGRLIFTTWRNPAMGRLDAGGLRAVMADTGDDAGGWALPDDGGGLVPFGRPVLVGDLVLWPTARRPYGVFAVRQEDGQQPDNPALLHRIPSGNLVWSNGCLLVANGYALTAFVPPDWLAEGEEPRMGRRVEPPPRPRWLTSRRVHPGGAGGEVDGGDKPHRSGERLDVRLDPYERFLHADGAIVCSKPDELRSRSRASGEVTWRAALPFTPTWSRPVNGLVLAGGEHGLAGLDAEKGDVRWTFPAPRPLSDFHVAGPRVVCIQDGRHLLCLDAPDGAVRWRRSAPGAAFEMPAPRGRISCLCPLGDSRLLVQASAYRWLLDAKTGGVVSSSASPLSPWPRPPVVGDTGVCVVPDRRNVLMLDAATGKPLWSHKLPGETTRSGEPPLVVPADDAVVVIEPRNIGYRARKLDRATGKPRWRDVVTLDIGALHPAGWHAANGKLYHAGGDHLSAWSLAEGRPLWKRSLPADGSWRIEKDGPRLLVWRARAAAARFRFRWLGVALQWHVGPLPAGDAWSVLVLDAEKGELLRRVSLDPESLPRGRPSGWESRPSVWPALSADRDEEGAPGPVVAHDRRGLIAAVGNRVVAFAVPPLK